ncbi:MAG: dephospho-CoA kinase [Bacilli bacterium]
MIVGITGSIASGKSLVTSYLLEKGFKVIDSDKIAKEQMEKPEIIQLLKTHFGNEIITGGEVNRLTLGAIIYNNEEKRLLLNSLIHPLVISEIKRLTKNLCEMTFVDVPLLYEAKMEAMFDKIIVVDVRPDLQIKRLMKRDQITEELAQLKIKSQWSLELKKAKADYVIDNSGRRTHTQLQVEQILRSLKNEN